MLQRWGGLNDCNNFVYWGGEGGTITVLLFVFQPTVKKQTVARTGFPVSCLSNVCCPALLCVCVCIRVRETLLLVAFHVGLCFVLTLYKRIHRETLCPRPEGMRLRRVSPLWKAAVALKCFFLARNHPGFSALSSRSPAVAGWACPRAAVCPGGGCGVSQPWKQGLACEFGGAALVRVLCLCCFSCIVWSHFVQLFLSLTGGETGFCL